MIVQREARITTGSSRTVAISGTTCPGVHQPPKATPDPPAAPYYYFLQKLDREAANA